MGSQRTSRRPRPRWRAHSYPTIPPPKRLRTTLLETLGALGALEGDGRVSWKRDEADVRRYRAIDD